MCRLGRLRGSRESPNLRSLSSGSHRMPEIPLRLERQPDLGIPARQRLEQECRVGADATTGLDDGVESLERNVHAPGRFSLRDRAVQGTPSGASLQDASVGDGSATLQYLSGSRCSARRTRPRRRIGRRFDLIVHTNRVPAPSIAHDRMQTIPRWHFEVFEPGHGVDLVQLPPNDRHSSRGMRRAAFVLTPFQMSLVASSASVRITR